MTSLVQPQKPKRIYTGVFEKRIIVVAYTLPKNYKTIIEHHLVAYELVFGAKRTHYFWVKTKEDKKLTPKELAECLKIGYEKDSSHNVPCQMAKSWVGVKEKRINLLEFKTHWG